MSLNLLQLNYYKTYSNWFYFWWCLFLSYLDVDKTIVFEVMFAMN